MAIDVALIILNFWYLICIYISVTSVSLKSVIKNQISSIFTVADFLSLTPSWNLYAIKLSMGREKDCSSSSWRFQPGTLSVKRIRNHGVNLYITIILMISSKMLLMIFFRWKSNLKIFPLIFYVWAEILNFQYREDLEKQEGCEQWSYS